MGNGESQPQPVIELMGEDDSVYNIDAAKKMVKNGPGTDDTKVFVICISGVYRSGKSFLLNLMKVYMDYYCKHGEDCGWTGSRHVPIRGGNWAQGKRTVTQGIWMYMYPQLVNGRAIILMDCQGNKDLMKSSPTLDNQILFLGLQMSDVHILNVDRTLGTEDFDRMGLCVYHADDKSTENLFERQMFLIRNWANSEEPDSIDTVIRDTASPSAKKAAKGIKRAFRSVEMETLPHPGRGVDGKSVDDNLRLGDVDPVFLVEARALCHKLVIKLALAATKTKDDVFIKFVYVSQRCIGKMKTPQEAYEESMILKAFDSAMHYFKEQVEKLKEKKMIAEEMDAKLNVIYMKTVDKFKSDSRVKQCDNKRFIADYLRNIDEAYAQTQELLQNKIKYERLAQEKEDAKKEAKSAKQKLADREKECQRANNEVNRLRKERANAQTSGEEKLAEEKLRMAEEIARVKEAARKEDERREREAIAREREAVAREREAVREHKRELDAMIERCENPSVPDAAIKLGKSLWNFAKGIFTR